MTAENLYLSTEQYLSALKKLRDKIANGEELVDVDDDFPGNKDSWCSWGLCIFSPVRSGKNTDDFARFSAGVSYLYLDLYLARRARDLSQSDTVAQSLSEAIEGALAADEAKTIGAMLKCARALEWIEGAS